MAYTRFNGTFRSSDGVHRIHYYIDEPEDAAYAAVQIVHGQRESMKNYLDLVDYLTSRGIIVCGCDLPCHGRTIADGQTGGKNENLTGNPQDKHTKHGWHYLMKDEAHLARYMKMNWPELPLFVYGSGTGSLMVRYSGKYFKSYSGIILEGTESRPSGLRRLLWLTGILVKFRGEEYPCKLLEMATDCRFNRGFCREKDRFSWYSEDPEFRKQLHRDSDARSCHTAGAWHDYGTLLRKANEKSAYYNIGAGVPILILHGEDDPLARLGKGAQDVCVRFREAGHPVQQYIYPKMRHHIHEGEGSQKVFFDLNRWIRKQCRNLSS